MTYQDTRKSPEYRDTTVKTTTNWSANAMEAQIHHKNKID